MVHSLAAIDPSLLENSALGLTGGSIIVALVLLKVVSSIVGKIVSTIVMVALALGGWSQRTEITNCVEAVRAQATAGSTLEATCTFFGQDVTLKVPIPAA
jgi:hypothetical protein